MIALHEVQTIHVELSTYCNAACPLCARNDYGYKTRTDFPLINLSLDQWETIFKDVQLPNLRKIAFSGNYGDPFMCKEVVPIVDYCAETFPNVVLDFSTNGSIRTPSFWKSFAEKRNVQVRFGLDGIGDTHSLHRIGTNFDTVIKNATSFIDAGGKAIWMMIRFKHNTHQVETARKMAKELGFFNFVVKENGKTLGWVFTNDTEGYWILPANKRVETDMLKRPEVFEPFVRNDLDDFKEQERKWVECGREVSCNSLNNKAIYIAADGKVYPCCWLGKYPDTYKFNNFYKVIGDIENQADVVGLKKSVQWFDRVRTSWEKQSIDNGMLMSCVGCAKGNFFQEA